VRAKSPIQLLPVKLLLVLTVATVAAGHFALPAWSAQKGQSPPAAENDFHLRNADTAIHLCNRGDIYVPFEDLARLIDPQDKAVLMDRREFKKLCSAAEANALLPASVQLGQIKQAQYSGVITDETLFLTGKLDVVSLSDGPIAIPLRFGHVGLSRAVLDDRPAPLGRDKKGRLVLIVTAKGTHRLEVSGTVKLKELTGGGMQFAVSLPECVAGTMKLTAPDDLEINATVPATSAVYDKQKDCTNIELTIGGQERLTVILTGNGRRQDDRPILLGESATTVRFNRSYQQLDCLYTAQILRRQVRQLQFQLPPNWTVTEVTCPSLAKWSVTQTDNQPVVKKGTDHKILTVNLRSGKLGTVPLRIRATAGFAPEQWRTPGVILSDAAFQRGYLMVHTDEELRLQGEKLDDARREDVSAAGSLPGMISGGTGRLYFHWGDKWSVRFDPAVLTPRCSIREKQMFTVAPEQLELNSQFEVTAVERDLFALTFVLPGKARQWYLKTLKVEDKTTGFQYRLVEHDDKRLLKIELARPIRPEKTVNVSIILHHIPGNWYWPSKAAPRTVTVPLIESRAATVEGEAAVQATGSLFTRVLPSSLPVGLEEIPVGRLASLGLSREVRHAYSYKKSMRGDIEIEVSRRRPRIAGRSVGLISVRSQSITGNWRITYNITRARARQLYLLTDKILGEKLNITSATPISSKNIVESSDKTFLLPEETLQRYNLWLLNLDQQTLGDVIVDVRYELPPSALREETDNLISAPLVRPICRGQANEWLAVQAGEELALTIQAVGAKETDAVDLPPLPIPAHRVLASFRLKPISIQTPTPQATIPEPKSESEPASKAEAEPEAAITLKTTVHENYEIPSALAVSGALTTYLDVRGGQRTEAVLHVANAGRQFLTVRLPKGARLWSLRVAGKQAGPQRSPDGDYQIALARSRQPIPIKIVYVFRPKDKANLNHLSLGGIMLPGVQMNKINWAVAPPPGYRITAQPGKMQTRDMDRPTPAYVQIYNVFQEHFFGGMLFMPSLGRARELSKGISTASQLNGIGKAIFMYRNDYDKQWPDTLERLIETEEVDPKMLYDADGYRFEYFPPAGKTDVSAGTIIARSSVIEGRRAVLFADGHVKIIPVDKDAMGYYQEDKRTKADKAMVRHEGEQVRPAKPKDQKAAQRALGIRHTRRGRLTLPVDLIPAAGIEPQVTFTALDNTELIVSLTSRAGMDSRWWVGLLLILVVGVATAHGKTKKKAIFIVSILFVSSLLALLWPQTTYFANGSFLAAALLLPFYLLFALIRWLWKTSPAAAAKQPAKSAAPVALPLLLFLLLSLLLAGSTQAAAAAKATDNQPDKSRQKNQSTKLNEQSALPPVIIPYRGDPTRAENSDKILISYAEYIKLWNHAHPEDTLETPPPDTDISLAGVKYDVLITKEKLHLTLSADVATYGKDWVVLPLPLEHLAVTEVTLDGKPAQIQRGPKGMTLMLPHRITGRLRLKAVAEPKYSGRRGSSAFSLPPLPGAVMNIILPAEDLDLEVDGAEGQISQQKVNDYIKWFVPLGMARRLTLNWQPKAEHQLADRTLTSQTEHQFCAFHWAVLGTSKITYSFSSGQHDRFTLLLPTNITLTDLKGANIRDHQTVAKIKLDGMMFSKIQVRLHRPAQKQFELTVRWAGELPEFDGNSRLFLPRADEVQRESGTVTFYSAGGMKIDTTLLEGGRKVSLPDTEAIPDFGWEQQGQQKQQDRPATERVSPVAKYNWHYRPFATSVRFSRETATAEIELDQLVRVTADRAQLIVQTKLTAKNGRLFGADFALPKGYELLSVVGPVVADFYEHNQDRGQGQDNYLHVNFSSAPLKTTLALVLVNNNISLDNFATPVITSLDAENQPLSEQTGRIAVQLAASLEARTITSENLKPMAPEALKGWLSRDQITAVQFAYRYRHADPILKLNIRRLPSKVRVDIFAGLVVRATSAAYTYRLRYHISGSPIDHLRLSLPREYALLTAVESPALRSLTRSDDGNGQTILKLALINEVTGEVDVTVNFDLPLDSSTRELVVPRIETDAPAGYRAVVAVQNMSRHNISTGDETNLTGLPLSEQKKIISSQLRQSLQYVFQSFEDNWSLRLNISPARSATRIQAVVDLLALTTIIDRNGRYRCEARLSLQNRSEQFLRVKVPRSMRLWSAEVAGEPVKPVKPVKPIIASDGHSEVILIPLVKTSPGGLPYDIHLYFAGEGIGAMNGISSLEPPGIEIEGIPVMQTTWSLRLPGGYRYLRPGGNMSAVTGTAELLSISIEARLKQLQRLGKSYRESSISRNRRRMAGHNVLSFGKQITTEIKQAQSYLEANRTQMSGDDYSRLSSQLQQQQLSQGGVISGHKQYVQRQEEQARNDINTFLNISASNRGMAEVSRNSALMVKPEFVGANEKKQIANLQKQLQTSQRQQKEISQRQNAAQFTQQQAIMKGQLDELKAGGRGGRYFRQQSQKAQSIAETQRPQIKSDRTIQERDRKSLRKGEKTGLPMMPGGMGIPSGASKTSSTDETPSIAAAAVEKEQPAYVAGGVYSLPVSLPEGEVRLDFARPSGSAELRIWAVPVGMINKLYGSVTITGLLCLLLLIIRVWPRPTSRVPLTAGRVIKYVLLLIMLSVFLGLFGLVASLFIILLNESVKGAAAQHNEGKSS
jgi:hypothetical protein